MAGRNEETSADLPAHVRRHLESLRAAGVDWLSAVWTRGQGEEGTRGGDETTIDSTTASDPPVPLSPLPLVPSSPCPIAAAPATSTAEQRKGELQLLAEQVSGCTRCKELASTRTQTVFGVGRIDPDVCFLGEAPGREEDASGEPFVGAAGQLLTRIIAAMGLTREEVYICNILRCRPPNNRPPAPAEAANCREWLDKTLGLVRPKTICALGASAVKYLTGTTQGITRLRGKWLDYHGTPVLCTFHPSYLLRDPTKKREVWEDMKTLLTRLGRPIPTK